MNDLIAEGAVVVQNATILSDVTVDHSNVSVASVNCNQSIVTHDKVAEWSGQANESELMSGVARGELMSGVARGELMGGVARSELMSGVARSELMSGVARGELMDTATNNVLVNEITTNSLVNEITSNTPSAASLVSGDSLASSSSIPVLPTTLQPASLVTEELMAQTPPVQEDSRPVDYWMSFSSVSLTNNSLL